MGRDHENDQSLLVIDWAVIRFLGNEIFKDTDQCIRVIEKSIFDNMM